MNADVTVSRREFLVAGAGMAMAATLPRSAAATTQEADDMLKKLIGNAVPKEGRIQLRLKDVAESGAAEPIAVAVDSPMTAADHVKAIHILAEGNPSAGVASWSFGPRSGKAEVAFRMRLAKSQIVRAYAVMSDGTVWSAKQEIKVTVGGCGG